VAADILAMDGWTKGSGLDVWREHPGSNTYQGSYYALKMNSSVATSGVHWPTLAQAQSAVFLDRFKGRTITFGAWVKTAAADDFKLRVYDNGTNPDSYSDPNVASGNFQWLEVTHTVSTDVTDLRFILFDADTAVDIYVSQPMLVFGSSIGEGNYSRPSGEIVNCEKYIQTQNNAALAATDDKILNLEAMSSGKIPKGCKAVYMSAEVVNSSITSDQGVRWGASVTNFTLTCNPKVNNVYEQSTGRVECDSNGDIYQLVRETDATLTGLYQNFTSVELR
jgi:hypothetical protein